MVERSIWTHCRATPLTSCSGLLFGRGSFGTPSFGRRFHRGFRGFRGARLVRLGLRGGARLLLLPFVRHVRARRGDDLARAFGAYALDLEVLLVGFRQLLGGAESPLEQQFGVDVADSRNRVERGTGGARLFLGLGLAAHVELPSGKPVRQAYVLAALADRQRELI